MKNNDVEEMWWDEDGNLFVKKTDGNTWKFCDAQIVSAKMTYDSEDVIVEELPIPLIGIAPVPAVYIEGEIGSHYEGYDVILHGFRDKIRAIKKLRELIKDLGLKEGKDLVENTPCRIKEGIGYNDAVMAVNELASIGCVATIAESNKND